MPLPAEFPPLFSQISRVKDTGTLAVEIAGQIWELLPERSVFWREESCLVVGDLHLGKAHHFTRGGVPLPAQADSENLVRLARLIDRYRPAILLLLGDLFHSHENAHVEQAVRFFAHYGGIRKVLVAGNHDVLEPSWYTRMGLEVVEDSLGFGPFRFRHEPEVESGKGSSGAYPVSGHVHPGVRLYGRGRQSLMLPCFCFGAEQAILPAFGNLTGLYPVRPAPGDRVFAIADDRVLACSGAVAVRT